MVKEHGRYTKYLYAEKITIIQVRCTNTECQKTHALIPDFSVPGCSIGMAELNAFITKRAAGETVLEAGDAFIRSGMSPDYPKDLHRRLKARCRNLLTFVFDVHTIFAGNVPHDYAVLTRILAIKLAGFASEPVSFLNNACRGYRCNPVFFSRCTILQFPENIAKDKFSYNTTSEKHKREPDKFP